MKLRWVLMAVAAVVIFGSVALAGCGTSVSSSFETEAVTSTTGVPKVDKAKFADVWRALMEIESATAVGVTYANFGPLVQNFFTEYKLVPQSGLSPAEADAMDTLRVIALAYADSYTLWQKKLDAEYGTIRVKSDSKETFDRALEMVELYGLETREYPAGGHPYTIISSAAVEVVWSWASDKTDGIRPLLTP